MSIAGIGFDLVDTKRFESPSVSLIERLFNVSEIEYSKSFSKSSVHLAGCFAVKEAFLKALGAGLSNGISWLDIEVRHMGSGQPFVLFRGEKTPAKVSISHTETTAGAVVLLTEPIDIHS
jgi:holo-[acyl-carrier protein] synthase